MEPGYGSPVLPVLRPRLVLALVLTAVATLAFVSPASAAARPDLVVSDLASPATPKAAGQSITLSTTVRNGGTARPKVESRVRYYLSADRVRGADRALAGLLSTPRLAPGASRTARAALTIPAATPSARYYVIACADGTSLIPESRESNNCRASVGRVRVMTPTNLSLSLAASPSTAVVGHETTVKATATNTGASVANSAAVVFAVPAGTTASNTTGCSVAESTVTCPLTSPLAPAGSATASISLTPSATGNVNATAVLAAPTEYIDTTPSDDSAQATITAVTAQSDLMAFADDQVLGDNQTNAAWAHFVEQHTVTVRNHGPAPAPNAQVQVFFEPNAGFRQYSAPPGVTCTLGYPVVCDLGTLGVGLDNDIEIDFDVRWRSYGAQSVSLVTSSDYEDAGPNEDMSLPVEVKELTEGTSITPVNNSTQDLSNPIIYGLRAALLGDQNDPLGNLVKLNGTIDPAGDVDWYRFIVPAGGDVTLETYNGDGSTCDIDTVISLYSQGGTQLVFDDDHGINNCSRIAPDTHPGSANLAEGHYWVRVNHFAADKTVPADPGYELQGTITP